MGTAAIKNFCLFLVRGFREAAFFFFLNDSAIKEGAGGQGRAIKEKTLLPTSKFPNAIKLEEGGGEGLNGTGIKKISRLT